MNAIKSSPLIAISLLILLSTVIRWPAFLNPVRGSHAWLTAHTVMTTQIWETEGISTYKYNPIYTFPTSSDSNLRTLASGLPDDSGNFFYVSYPPLSFYVAYLYFTILLMKPNLIGLYILNILIQSITAFIIYVLICRLDSNHSTSKLYIPAFLASTLYIFSAQNLWCHVYMYFADTLIQLVWLLYIFFAFLIFKRQKADNPIILSLFALTNFLLVYTEWLGLFTSATLFLYAIYKAYKQPTFVPATIIIGLASTLALALTIFQYSNIDGLTSFLNTSANKYATRNGYTPENIYQVKLKIHSLLSHYWRLPKANIILIIGFFSLSLVSIRKKQYFNHDHSFLIFLTLIPIILHHIVFLEFSSMHDFSTLKSSVLFCFLISFAFNSIDYSKDYKESAIDKKKIAFSLFIFIMLLNVALYYSKESFDNRSIFTVNSKVIMASSKNSETLYAITKGDRNNGVMVFMGEERAFSTQIQLLTQRNILALPNRRAAVDHLKEYEKEEGKVYIFDLYGRMAGIESYKTD